MLLLKIILIIVSVLLAGSVALNIRLIKTLMTANSMVARINNSFKSYKEG